VFIIAYLPIKLKNLYATADVDKYIFERHRNKAIEGSNFKLLNTHIIQSTHHND